MKKLATILLMLMFVLSSGYAINQKVQPGERAITFARPSTPIVFIAQQKYIKPFSTLAFRYDTILYIDSTQRPLIYDYIPGFFGDGKNFTDTINTRSERFSPTGYAKAYVDEVTIGLAISNLVDMGNDSLNAHALTIKIKNQIQPAGRVPFESFKPAVDSVSLSFNELSAYPTNGSFFFITIPMNHKLAQKEFFVELSPAINYGQDIHDVNFQNYFAVFRDSNFFDITVGGVDISKVRGYYTLFRRDTSNVSIYQDRQKNLYYGNYWITASVTNNPTAGGSNAVDETKLLGDALAQNYPNPFNPSTEIRYSTSEHVYTTLKVFNALGREVKTLVDGYVDAGEHTANFAADNLPSGTYYYTLKAGSFTQTKRMVLAK